MSDIWISAFVVIKSKWTDEEKIKVGGLVLQALKDRWRENQSLPVDITLDNSGSHTQITVGTS